MGDSSLDDFFAKKDKRKKNKKLAGEEISGEDKVNRKKGRDSNSNTGTNKNQNEDDEWRDFDHDKNRDYSGLKIQTLNIKDREEEFREQKLQENMPEKKEDDPGPWKKRATSPNSGPQSESGAPPATTATNTTVPSTVDDEKKKQADTTNSNTGTSSAPPGKYVCPQRRNQPPPSTQPLHRATMAQISKSGRTGAVPTFDDKHFPSLN